MYGQKRLFAVTLLLLFSLSHPADAAAVGFKPAVNYLVGTAPRAVAFGDFNGDGNMDLAIANNGDPNANDDGSVSIMLGNGDGTFQAQKNVVVGKNPCPGLDLPSLLDSGLPHDAYGLSRSLVECATNLRYLT